MMLRIDQCYGDPGLEGLSGRHVLKISMQDKKYKNVVKDHPNRDHQDGFSPYFVCAVRPGTAIAIHSGFPIAICFSVVLNDSICVINYANLQKNVLC